MLFRFNNRVSDRDNIVQQFPIPDIPVNDFIHFRFLHMSENKRFFTWQGNLDSRFGIAIPHASGLCHQCIYFFTIQCFNEIIHDLFGSGSDPASCHRYPDLYHLFRMITFFSNIQGRAQGFTHLPKIIQCFHFIHGLHYFKV